MKIIGIFILALELVALALQLKNECRKNSFTFGNFKDYFTSFNNPFSKPAPKLNPKQKMWAKFASINSSIKRRKTK